MFWGFIFPVQVVSYWGAQGGVCSSPFSMLVVALPWTAPLVSLGPDCISTLPTIFVVASSCLAVKILVCQPLGPFLGYLCRHGWYLGVSTRQGELGVLCHPHILRFSIAISESLRADALTPANILSSLKCTRSSASINDCYFNLYYDGYKVMAFPTPSRPPHLPVTTLHYPASNSPPARDGIVPTPNLYVEARAPSVVIFGNGASKEVK